jgi:hypothetical protein
MSLQVVELLARAPEMARPDAIITAVGTKIFISAEEVSWGCVEWVFTPTSWGLLSSLII